MSDRPAIVDETATRAYSEAMKRAHAQVERRALRMELIAKFWRDHPEASHPEYEAFLRVLDAERRPDTPPGC